MPSSIAVDILAERVRALLPDTHLSQRRMFGGVAFMLDGNMLCCASRSGVMFRVGKAAESAALSRPFAQPCLGTGRPMAGFIMVSLEGLGDDTVLSDWITLARAYVDTLAPKPTKMGRGRNGS